MRIEINEDIEKYEETVIMGLTAQQAVFSALSLLVGAGIVLFLYEKIGMMASCYLATPFVIPIALMGFYRYNGMNFFQFFVRFIKSFTLTRPLPYCSTESRKAYEKLLVPSKDEQKKQLKPEKEEKKECRKKVKTISKKVEKKRHSRLGAALRIISLTFLTVILFLAGYLFYEYGIQQGMDAEGIMKNCAKVLKYLFK